MKINMENEKMLRKKKISIKEGSKPFVSMNQTLSHLLVFSSLAITPNLLGFENTQTLPKGVRSLNIKRVSADIQSKSNAAWTPVPLSDPLEKSITFKDVLADEYGLKKTQLEGFLDAYGFGHSDVLGTFSADLKGRVDVTAPVFMYGITDDLTFAIAAPFYEAKMSVGLGFAHSTTAERFVAQLNDPYVNQTASAREAAENLNDAVGKMQETLSENGFRSMTNWEKSGFGDITLAGKWRFLKHEQFSMSTTSGIVIPNGHRDDADILHDIPFTDGSTDIFSSLSIDVPLNQNFLINQYAKYTYQMPTEREVRMITPDEVVKVNKDYIEVKPGDQMDLEVSVQHTFQKNFNWGLGWMAHKKLGEDYRLAEYNPIVENELQNGTDELAFHAALEIGYSTVEAYQDNEFPLPFMTSVQYKRHLASRNSSTNSFLTMDVSLFF